MRVCVQVLAVSLKSVHTVGNFRLTKKKTKRTNDQIKHATTAKQLQLKKCLIVIYTDDNETGMNDYRRRR